MKVCVTADFHGGFPPEIPHCDLLLFAGDLGHPPRWPGATHVTFGNLWEGWLQMLPMPVIGIAGNHDFNSDEFRELPWTYLENSATTVVTPQKEGARQTRVWGSPFSLKFLNWAHMASDEVLANIYAEIPDDTEIILSHGPPYGSGDMAQGRTHVGSRSLERRCKELPNLKLVACGHIHESYGVYRVPSFPNARDIRYTVVNGSWVDAQYRPGNKPIVVEL